ncbi:hypothetical protein D1007_55899 [Hordeum vulgare]|nr:hypothetical protein D1007_55899 [Hordeum vulgare]
MDSKPEAHTAVAQPLAYPRMSPEDLARPLTPPVVAPAGSNPYVLSSPSSRPPAISTKENLMEMFIRRPSTCCSISPPHGDIFQSYLLSELSALGPFKLKLKFVGIFSYKPYTLWIH